MKKILLCFLSLIFLASCGNNINEKFYDCIDGRTKFKKEEIVLLKTGYFTNSVIKGKITNIDCSNGYPIYSFVSEDNKIGIETREVNFIKN